EMEHHEQLGKTIFKLGGYPVLGGANYPWSGSFVNYAGDLRKILEINIRGEELAIYNYEKTILRLTNHQVIKLLERIILDEELHIKIFSDLLAELD
ncbi:MAG TPA: ferritin-like domain-containing protein, partial [Eubacteriales bacterium]|nr:ferritin-like domain-containing protein [Eubacteriales bacterium]